MLKKASICCFLFLGMVYVRFGDISRRPGRDTRLRYRSESRASSKAAIAASIFCRGSVLQAVGHTVVGFLFLVAHLFDAAADFIKSSLISPIVARRSLFMARLHSVCPCRLLPDKLDQIVHTRYRRSNVVEPVETAE